MAIPSSFLFLCFFATLSVGALIPLRVLLTKVDEFSNYSSELHLILHTFVYLSLSYGFLFIPSLRLHESDSDRMSSSISRSLLLSYFPAILWLSPDTFVTNWLAFGFLFAFLCNLFFMSFDMLRRLLNTPSNDDSQTISMTFFHWLAWFIFIGFARIIYHEDHIIEIEDEISVYPCLVGLAVVCTLHSRAHTSEFLVSIQVPLWIKIVVGMVCNILANHYLKDKGYPLFWLVVCLAIFLMGNMATMHSTCHTAIFGFLVSVIVDIAGEIFGLNIYMWLVGGVCAALLLFFVRLDEFNRRYPGGEELELSTLSPRPSARLEQQPRPDPGPSARLEQLRRWASAV